jgi:putative transposase
MRKLQFAEGQFYHIYNRGVDKRKIFSDNSDYQRFLLSMWLMNDEQNDLMSQWQDFRAANPNAEPNSFPRLSLGKGKSLVELVCYSLLPNHYHFILTQLVEKGIEKFMHRIGVGYSMYFNKKYDRSGALFQGTFKASEIKPNNLLYLSAYVNCNTEIHGIARSETYRWSSFPEYIGERKKGLCENGKKVILDDFNGGKDYKKFVEENTKYFRERKNDEKMMLENVS